MATISIYSDMSDACEVIRMEGGTSIGDAFPELDFSHRIIIVNGKAAGPEHILKDTDTVIIRSIPMVIESLGLGLSILLYVSIAAGVAGIGVGIWSGVESYNARCNAQEAQKKLDAMKANSRDDITNLPYLKGARNSVATNKTQPYIIGENLFTPYYLASSGGSQQHFSTIDGKDGNIQKNHMVFECGFNYQVIKKISVDDVTVKNFDDTEPQIKMAGNFGRSLATDEDDTFEIVQSGEDMEFPYYNERVVEEVSGKEIKKSDDESYEPLLFTLAKNSYAADVCILFNGLCAYSENGARVARAVKIRAYYSLDEGESWTEFFFAGASDQTSVRLLSNTEIDWAIDNGYLQINLMPAQSKLGQAKLYLMATDEGRKLGYFTVADGTSRELGESNVSAPGFPAPGTPQNELALPVYNSAYRQTVTSVFMRNTLNQVRFNAHVDFDFAQVKSLDHPIQIKLTCETKKKSNAKDSCYVQWVHSYIFSRDAALADNAIMPEPILEAPERFVSTLLGMTVRATDSNESKFDKVNIISQGCARIYRNGAWTENKYPTSNPAAWLLEVLTSHTHPASQVDDSEIDLDSFARLYEFCEHPVGDDPDYRIECNFVVTNGNTKESLLERICSTCRAVLYRSIYGQIAVAYDDYKPNPIALLNEQNLLSFSWEKRNTRQVDGVICKFINKDLGYDNDSIVVFPTGLEGARTGGQTLSEITLEGVTNHKQAVRHARYLMAVDRLRPRKITAVVGNEGFYFTPLSRIVIQHPSINTGLGSTRIKECIIDNFKITGLVLYDAVEYNPNDPDGYGVIIDAAYEKDGAEYTPLISRRYTAEGTSADTNWRTDTIMFDRPISVNADIIPYPDNVVSFGRLSNGSFDTITNDFIITGIEAAGENEYRLTLVDYNEAIYSGADNTPIPAYTPSTQKSAVPQGNIPPASDNESLDMAMKVAELSGRYAARQEASDAAQEAADKITKGIHFSSVNRVEVRTPSIEELIAKIDEAVNTSSAGLEITEERLFVQMKNEAEGLLAQVELTAEHLRTLLSKVTAAESAISMLNQTAEEISSTVARHTTDIVTVNSSISQINQTADKITAAVFENDGTTPKTEALQSSLAITSNAVESMVKGGGAEGYMGLSIELPAMVRYSDMVKSDDPIIYKWTDKSAAITKELIEAVYAQTSVNGSIVPYFTIRDDATGEQIKALWDEMKKAGLLASQITLDASQIQVTGTTVFGSGKLADGLEAAETALKNDATSKADAAYNNAKNYVDGKGYATTGNVADSRDAVAQKLGYDSYTDMVSKAENGQTVIRGGSLNTGLINTDELFAKNIVIKRKEIDTETALSVISTLALNQYLSYALIQQNTIAVEGDVVEYDFSGGSTQGQTQHHSETVAAATEHFQSNAYILGGNLYCWYGGSGPQGYASNYKLKHTSVLNGSIQSSDYDHELKTGFKVEGNGKAEFNDVTVRGRVEASDGEFHGVIKAKSVDIDNICAGDVFLHKNATICYRGKIRIKLKWDIKEGYGSISVYHNNSRFFYEYDIDTAGSYEQDIDVDYGDSVGFSVNSGPNIHSYIEYGCYIEGGNWLLRQLYK